MGDGTWWSVTDVDFVVDRDVSPGEPSISLRGRDLVRRLDRSDLHQADMTGANLDGASLTGANLTDVRLNCADERHLILTDDRSKAGCASARKAKFTYARLSGASMNAIDLRGADLQEANLGSAQMKYAWLAGANFSSAKLQKADITGGARAQGVDFLLANLEGADLTGAQLQYADFSNAAMRGITLEHAQLQGATLRDADLDGAYLRRIRLQGADLSGSNLRGADLRQSQVWMTLPPETDRLRLADLRTVAVAPSTRKNTNQLMSSVYAIEDPRLRFNVRESLTGLIDVAKSSAWQGSDDARFWSSLETIGLPGMAIDYNRELTAYLETPCSGERLEVGGQLPIVIDRHPRSPMVQTKPEARIITALPRRTLGDVNQPRQAFAHVEPRRGPRLHRRSTSTGCVFFLVRGATATVRKSASRSRSVRRQRHPHLRLPQIRPPQVRAGPAP